MWWVFMVVFVALTVGEFESKERKRPDTPKSKACAVQAATHADKVTRPGGFPEYQMQWAGNEEDEYTRCMR